MDQKVFVIGLGLIGGSIALTIKKSKHAMIYGYDINEERSKLAKSLKVIDDYVTSIEEGAANADFIIISVPVTESVKVLQVLANSDLKHKVIITDVGSTKQKVIEGAKILPSHVTFIGGHPMAGSHKSGVEAANELLFENAYYILTRTEQVGDEQLTEIKDWLTGTNAKFIEMRAEEHDLVAGVISHFPHVIASSLVQHAESYYREHPLVADLAAGGFKDITRIASSNPKMWKDILLHNREALLTLFDSWMIQMRDIQTKLKELKEEEIYDFFAHAKSFRDGLPSKKKGAIHAYYDLFVDVPDHPGVIAEITTLLAKHEINITNIEIMETREDIYGVLRLSCRNDKDREEAQRLIGKSYETFILN